MNGSYFRLPNAISARYFQFVYPLSQSRHLRSNYSSHYFLLDIFAHREYFASWKKRMHFSPFLELKSWSVFDVIVVWDNSHSEFQWGSRPHRLAVPFSFHGSLEVLWSHLWRYFFFFSLPDFGFVVATYRRRHWNPMSVRLWCVASQILWEWDKFTGSELFLLGRFAQLCCKGVMIWGKGGGVRWCELCDIVISIGARAVEWMDSNVFRNAVIIIFRK